MPVEGRRGTAALERLGALLEESLSLWAVAGSVAVEDTWILVSAAATRVSVRRNTEGDGLIRWFVTIAGAPERPCTSVLGVLRAVRAALVDEAPAPRLRIGSGQLAP
jgi:hypothetical protein